MKLREFVEQIDHLLWTGAIEGKQVLKLHHLLQAYQQGKLSAEGMQDAIDQCDPELLQNWLDEQLPPLE